MSNNESHQLLTKELIAVQARLDRNAHGHIRQALELQHLDNLATFVSTIGGVIAMALSAAFLGEAISSRWAALLLVIVSGLITLVSVMQAIWKPGERARRHKDWSVKFAGLESDCDLALRGTGSKDIGQILAEVGLLSSQVDLVPDRLWGRPSASHREIAKSMFEKKSDQ